MVVNGGCVAEAWCMVVNGGCVAEVWCMVVNGGCVAEAWCMVVNGGCIAEVWCMVVNGGCVAEAWCMVVNGGCVAEAWSATCSIWSEASHKVRVAAVESVHQISQRRFEVPDKRRQLRVSLRHRQADAARALRRQPTTAAAATTTATTTAAAAASDAINAVGKAIWRRDVERRSDCSARVCPDRSAESRNESACCALPLSQLSSVHGLFKTPRRRLAEGEHVGHEA
jgi:hypothetical protein